MIDSLFSIEDREFFLSESLVVSNNLTIFVA